STYGIFFAGADGTLRYFAIFENEFDGTISLAEITSQIKQPNQYSDETVIETFETENGTLYHVDVEDSHRDRLYFLYNDGTRMHICEQSPISYISFSPDESKLIWNDYEWEHNASVCIYNFEKHSLTSKPMDELGENYTPSFMAWLDNRYFLFVVQFDHGTVARGGDIYVYDTETHDSRLLIDANYDSPRELMINSFAIDGQNITFSGYDYNYDTDLYADWEYTVTTDFVYDLIKKGSYVTLEIDDGKPTQKPPQVPNGETLIESFQFEKGYIYHTQNTKTQKHFLRVMFYDGTVTDIYEDDCIAYVDYNLSAERLIWNDYGSSAETTVCMYILGTNVLEEDILQELDEGHTVSSMKWYAYHDRYILFVTQPIQGTDIHDGDVYIHDMKYQATVKIIDARDNLRITSIDERAELITAVYYNEADGSYTEMTYQITYEKLSALLEDQYGILPLHAEDCREVVAPLDCPVDVVPTDKEPSIRFDSHAQEVFEFTFTKDVKGFAIVKIDTGVAYDITVDPLGEPTDYKAGDTLVYSMYINDISDSRGFVLIGEDGKLHYYALRGPDMAGFSSDYSVVEVTDHPLLTVDGKTPDFNP
ncbi:MAG: DUF4652 domain-containing protein, partial [Clostridia bacterium]|nr:DUF4652 domain-containing protein [Clostridia bacterium]